MTSDSQGIPASKKFLEEKTATRDWFSTYPALPMRIDKPFVEPSNSNNQISNAHASRNVFGEGSWAETTNSTCAPQFNLAQSPRVDDPADEYLTLEKTEKYNLEALIESNRLDRGPEHFKLDSNFPNKVVHPDNLSAETEFPEMSKKAQESNPLRRRRRRYSISSIPASAISAFSAFRRIPQTLRLPKRSTAQLLLNSSIMFGREFCYAVEGGLTTPILLSIGLPLNMYSLVWVLSPILGFILQPIIGSLSDRCKCRWGRRRPFILGLAVLLLVGLTLFLNGEQFVTMFSSGGSNRRFSTIGSTTVTAIAATVTGVVLFDFSADFIEGPIRAYAMDVCDEEDIRRSLLFQAIFTGAGGAFGYASGGVSWTRDTTLGRFFASDRQVVYTASAIIFIVCCIFNLLSIRENEPNCQRLNENNQNIIPRSKHPNKSASLLNNNQPKNLHNFHKSHRKKFEQAERKDDHEVDAESVVLKILARKNRNRLFEEFEQDHMLKADPKKIELSNSKLRNFGDKKPRKCGKADKHETLIKRKKRKRLFNNSKKMKLNYQNLESMPLTTYGTFVPNEKLPSNAGNSSVISVYQPHQVTWPIAMFYQQHEHNKLLQNGYSESTNFAQSSSIRNAFQSIMIKNTSKDTETSSDEPDSIESFPSRHDLMLERLLPYASVDPALKHILHDNASRNPFENSKLKRKIFPEPVEENFSNVFSSISEKINPAVEERNHPNTSSESVGGLRGLFLSIKTMPKELRFLCVCHLLGWIAFLSIALFFTDFVGQVVMKGDPRAPSRSRIEQQYFRGVEIGNWGLTINATVSCFYCGLLKVVIRRLGFRVMYVFGYFSFALGVCLMAIFPTTVVVLCLSSAIGVMSATLYTIPYMLVAQYHEDYKTSQDTTMERGVGIDCALVTCMIQLAQMVTGLGIGALVNLTGTVTVTVIVASIIGCIGAIWAALLVKY